MHLLYFRFWMKVMQELGLVDGREPVKRLVTQGIVNGPDGRKMSKRFGNVVSPRAIVGRYGADVTRLFILFAGPPQDDMKWSDEQVEGISRFVNRVWRHWQTVKSAAAGAKTADAALAVSGTPAGDLRRKTHKTIRKFTRDLENLQFNTCVAGLMELSNVLGDVPPGDAGTNGALREAYEAFALLASPLAPHLAAELWSGLGRTDELQFAAWPGFDEALVVDDQVTYAVQVNGKLRGEILVPAAASEDDIKSVAQAHEKVAAQLEGKTVRKVVVVKGRLVNFVAT
jgi:leucyl-tRNA synthetase